MLGPPPAPSASRTLGWCQAGALPAGQQRAPTGRSHGWGALGLGHLHPAQASPAPSPPQSSAGERGGLHVAYGTPWVRGSASRGDARGEAPQASGSGAAQGLSGAARVPVGVSGCHPALPSAGSQCAQLRVRIVNGLGGRGASQGGRALAAMAGAPGPCGLPAPAGRGAPGLLL